MTEFYAHEAWCPHCSVSHPPGTKRCLHCGGGVLPVRPATGAGLRTPAPTAPRGPIEIASLPEIVAEEDADASERARAARPLRIGFAAIWIVMAIVGTLLRACSERG